MTDVTDPNVTFSWDAVTEATEYELQISTDGIFGTIIHTQTITTTSYNYTLPASDVYYWRVRGVHNGIAGDWSVGGQFTLQLNIVPQEANEQDLFNTMMPNLTDAFQFVIMDARPDGVMTTLQFTDGAVADVMVNLTVDNGLILITLSDIAIQGGGTQAQLDTLYQDIPVMMMATLDDLLPEDYIRIESLTITDVGMSIEVIGAQP